MIAQGRVFARRAGLPSVSSKCYERVIPPQYPPRSLQTGSKTPTGGGHEPRGRRHLQPLDRPHLGRRAAGPVLPSAGPGRRSGGRGRGPRGSACPVRTAEAADDLIGFRGVPVSKADTVVVPGGYSAEVLYAWGDPVGNGPEFKNDASNTYADQERQSGMHHDGIHYFPMPLGSTSSTRGLLVMNHEY